MEIIEQALTANENALGIKLIQTIDHDTKLVKINLQNSAPQGFKLRPVQVKCLMAYGSSDSEATITLVQCDRINHS